MPAIGIHHHKISVTDMERSLVFYRDLLGFELIYDALRENLPEYDRIMGLQDVRVRIAMLRTPRPAPGREAMIGLLQFLNPPPRAHCADVFDQGFSTIAVETNDIDADFRRLRKAGVESLSSVVQIVRGGRAVAKAVYVLDPDGLRIELYQPLVTIENAG